MEPRNFGSVPVDLDGASLFVTGGTGSFGRQFIRTILQRYKPQRVVIYSRDELKQYEMAQDLSPTDYPCLRYFIGDVRDGRRLESAMRGTDYVIHCAAMKQVTTAEYNPFECIHTNVLGAENLVNAAIATNVKRVIALSTDKAASPANLYGASKLASDKIFVAANHMSGEKGPRFSVVRYGNVVGSRGSVVEVFDRMIAGGTKSLPITDDRMTRFWITLTQGVDFVLSSLMTMHGGEIFVPKIPSMRVVDLAKAMAPELPQHIVGIRPGEKLHEVMITSDDSRTTYELEDRYVIQPSYVLWEDAPAFPAGSKPVAEGFCYASDTNQEWLDGSCLKHWLDVGAK